MKFAWAGVAAGIFGLTATAYFMHAHGSLGSTATAGPSYHQASLTHVTGSPKVSQSRATSVVTQAVKPPSKVVASTAPLSTTAFFSGVVEGFYGPAWSLENTVAILQFMRQRGMNTFVYAPKSDAYLRANWNQPYPPAALAQVANLVHAAQENHIHFVASISPGLSIVYSSAADRAALLEKIGQLQSIGVHTFMLSFDDIPQALDAADQSVYGNNLAWAQCALANFVVSQELKTHSDFRLIFTPTIYSGVADNPYWENLAQHLDPAVDVVWTGPWVLSPTITTAEVAQVRAEIGHSLIIWDNYPVNDYSYVMYHRPELFMGPLTGRQPGVVSQVQGYLFNPMLQPLASEVALWTGASFLRNPQGYNADQSWLHAINAVGGKAAGALSLFCQDTAQSYLNPNASTAVSNDLPAFWGSYQTHGNLTATALYHEFQQMAALNGQLAAALTPGLYQEIKPWSEQLSSQGQCGVDLIQALESQQNNQEMSATVVQNDLTLAQEVSTSTLKLGTTSPVNEFIQQVEAMAPFA